MRNIKRKNTSGKVIYRSKVQRNLALNPINTVIPKRTVYISRGIQSCHDFPDHMPLTQANGFSC